jgi:pimeloyl-ACP methyl ester carboxylesterase
VLKLVLVSTPAPTWRPDERLRRYTASPWASAPAFILGAPVRLWREIGAARPSLIDRSLAVAGYMCSVCLHPTSPARMAGRLRCLAGHDYSADARAVRAPTLVLTGEPELDRVVPVRGTREYLDLIPNATEGTLERTGHIGLVTRADAFAQRIRQFVIS